MLLKRLFKLKNIYKNRIFNMILVLIMIITLENYFIGCGTKNIKEIKTSKETSDKNMNEVIKEIRESQIACFTEIAYASKDKVILHGDVGLIVYNMVNKQIYRAIDLKCINMNHIQGDKVTILDVNKDANQILIYNDDIDDKDDKDIYLYNIENDTLEKTDTKKFTPDYDKRDYFDFERFKKYTDMDIVSNCFKIDDSNVCYLIYPKESGGAEGISYLQIVILNKETNEEKRYTIF
ncbi:hypothetical protein UT300005_13960 [Clostridium sp. CTA-5]